MKNLILVLVLVLCLVACSHQVSVIEKDGTLYARLNYTRYALSGPELSSYGVRCAVVNLNTVTIWKEGGCEPITRQLDELNSTELELIRIRSKLPPNYFAELRLIGAGSTVSETRSENRHIEIGKNSVVSLTDSNHNYIVVGNGAKLDMTGSNNNIIRIESGRSVTIINQQHQEIDNDEIRPFDKTMNGKKVESLYCRAPKSDSVKVLVELKDFVTFVTKKDELQMKPVECLNELDKMLVKSLKHEGICRVGY